MPSVNVTKENYEALGEYSGKFGFDSIPEFLNSLIPVGISRKKATTKYNKANAKGGKAKAKTGAKKTGAKPGRKPGRPAKAAAAAPAKSTTKPKVKPKAKPVATASAKPKVTVKPKLKKPILKPGSTNLVRKPDPDDVEEIVNDVDLEGGEE